ncbi:DUF268 domain-containing protein [Nocardioides seonyuensis]|uniref:DUF268 domain-containing protein n=1 Tax=Nocardioides seonyuensis TaxID=2518371 RepID=A0A4P7IJD1_9ACTN|nr:class I SAM-dependent methyltransferase [Nocardioides seonyuensis]QBX56873.1 DUF268 domain-containing protein [Nocardioides seonyuensis]
MPPLRRLPAVLARLAAFARERGVATVLASGLRWGWQWLRGHPRTGGSSGSFQWEGAALPYFVHPYHYTWLNERAVEVALAREILARHAGADVLEVGNVLSHYVSDPHSIVDKYEQAPGVLNLDVADLDLQREFDLVLAISTLEHVGLDEDVVDPAKPARAIRRLKAHLKPGGMLWVTHPVGYNCDLDDQIRSGEIEFTRLRALKREPTHNTWREVPLDQAWGTPYDRLLYTAHALVVGEYLAPQNQC